MKIRWHDEPQKHDYPAATSYLSLTMDRAAAEEVSRDLEEADMTEFAGLSLLGVSNSHIEKDRQLIIDEQKLSPLLLFRDEDSGRLVIADGYHRLCAVYKFDEDAFIPCKIV